LNPATKRLEIATTANQDPLLNLIPIIGVDIWEHAFYLQYLNVKVDVSFIPFAIRESNPLNLHDLVPQCHLERHQLPGG
jgi:hypothetical protein